MLMLVLMKRDTKNRNPNNPKSILVSKLDKIIYYTKFSFLTTIIEKKHTSKFASKLSLSTVIK